MKRSTLTGATLLFLFLCISGFAAYGVLTFQKDLHALDEAGAEDISWTAYQLELELAKLTKALVEFQVDELDINADDVNDRFDILWSRIALFQQGAVGKRLEKYDRDIQVIANLFTTMKEVDRQVVGLENGDNETANSLFLRFIGYQQLLSDFSRTVTLGEERLNHELRNDMMFRTNRTLVLSGLSTLVALLMLAFIYQQARKFELLALTNQKLAIAAEKASQSKSKFLTMMSHELRTPMNGVMGLLSLAQQNSVQPSQKRLLEQAEVSAKSMLGLLTDIFDFSALQAEDIALASNPFEIRHLIAALEEKFSAAAKREGMRSVIRISDDVPKYINGDFKRIHQAIGHLAQYVVETAGTRDIAIDLGYEDAALTARLSFAYSRSGGEWNPDLILGDGTRKGDKFATAALGPMIARGLIDTMGGTIKLDSNRSDRIIVVAKIPAEVVELNSLGLRLFAASEAMRTISRAALINENVIFYDDDPDIDVRMVIIESGGEIEKQFLAEARTLYPDAIYIALGTPDDPEAFDLNIKIPLNFSDFRNVVAANTKFN